MQFKNTEKIFALVDCNNFYASCERVFNPMLRYRPLVVLSNNDGCVIARSNEAKAIGIEMGVPFYECKHLIKRHNVAVYSSNFSLYGDMSSRVMETLSDFVPEIEIYSVDEAFLSMDSFKNLNVEEYSRLIRKVVRQWTGMPISIGIAHTKTLAKLANHLAKKDKKYRGVSNLINHPGRDQILDSIDVGNVWGIGRQLRKKLKQNRIRSALDLKNCSERWARKNLTVSGLRTVLELRGVSCISIDETPEDPKSVLSSRSFKKPVSELKELEEAIASYITIAAKKLRSHQLKTSAIQVFIKTNQHNKRDEQYSNSISTKLNNPSNYSPDLISAAKECLGKIFLEGYRYKRAGVIFYGLVPDSSKQLSLLLDSPALSIPKEKQIIKTEKKEELMNLIDSLNNKWGSETLQYAASGIQRSWMTKQSQKSPRYTTQWDEILKIQA